MTRVNVATLKNELSRFLRSVSEDGQEIVVVSHERAVARLVPFEPSAFAAIQAPVRPLSDLSKVRGIRPAKTFDVVGALTQDRRRR